MRLFSISISGLSVLADMAVGPVTVRAAGPVLDELRAGVDVSQTELFDRFEERVREAGAGAFAEVEATDRDEALGMVAEAVDVLRVFQHNAYGITHVAQFGLPGDVGGGVLFHAERSERTGIGYLYVGDRVGWTFADDDEWRASTLNRVAQSIDDANAPEGFRRALIGVQLLSRAIIETRPDLKMIEAVSALEAWLRPEGRMEPQTNRLARAMAYFNCAGCGRDRETCPYLELDPAKDGKRLKDLRTHGTEPPWLCSEWHRFVGWYDLRSAAVHGRGPQVDIKEASSAVFWVYRHVMPKVLDWLVEHPHDPIGDLESVLASLPPGPDWEARLGRLPGR